MATQQHHYSPTTGTELNKIEARQADTRMSTFRVLLTSLLFAAVVGIIMLAAFWRSTSPELERSSVGNPDETSSVSAPAPPAQTSGPDGATKSETAPAAAH